MAVAFTRLGDTENVMRRLKDVEAADRMRWLSGDQWPAVYGSGPGATGYVPGEGWDAAASVLHAVYEWPGIAPGLSHHELHRQAIAAGLRQPTMAGGVNLDESTTTTGTMLGFQRKPEPQWQRLTWSALAQRDGFEFWAVYGHWPDLRYAAVRLGGSRDHACLQWPTRRPDQRFQLAGKHSSPAARVARRGKPAGFDRAAGTTHHAHRATRLRRVLRPGRIHGGRRHRLRRKLSDVPALVVSQRGTAFTTSNIWPADRSWLVYTDFDLEATRVSGSTELIGDLCADDRLDTVRCDGYPVSALTAKPLAP